MNQKLKDYTEQPNPAVWQKISSTLRRRRILRRGLLWGGVVIVVAGVGVGVATYQNRTEETALRQTAMAESPIDAGLRGQTSPVQNAMPKPTARPVRTVPSVQNPGQPPEVEPSAQMEEPSVAALAVRPPAPVREETAVAPQKPAAVGNPEVSPAVTLPMTENLREEPVATGEEPLANVPEEKAVGNAGVSNASDLLLWFPNVFVPASDNEEVNRFHARQNVEGEQVSDFRMAIYNRAGSRVFFSSDINEAWDGKRDGQTLPQGAYVYVVFYTDKNGVQHHCKGTVTLVR